MFGRSPQTDKTEAMFASRARAHPPQSATLLNLPQKVIGHIWPHLSHKINLRQDRVLPPDKKTPPPKWLLLLPEAAVGYEADNCPLGLLGRFPKNKKNGLLEIFNLYMSRTKKCWPTAPSLPVHHLQNIWVGLWLWVGGHVILCGQVERYKRH